MSESIAEKIQREWNEFKAANDRAEEERKRFGEETAETRAMVDKANNAISELQGQVTEQIKASTDRIEELEERHQRTMMLGLPGGGKLQDEQRIAYANWQSMVTGKEVEPSNVDLEMVRNYTKAFVDYMRHGDRANPENLAYLNQMSVGSDADGGYWVSPDTSGRVAELIYETSPIRQLASIETISTDALEGTLDLGEAGSGWVGETEARTETDTPQIGRWRIPVHEQYAEPRTTQKLLDDAMVNVEAWLSGKVSGRFARKENLAFVSGDGVAKPRGFLTYTAGTPSAATWDVIEQVNIGHDASTISTNSADKLITLVFSLKSELRSGAVFGGTRLTQAAIRKVKDGDGNYLWQPNFQNLAAATLLGFPFVEMPDMPEIEADALALVFGNFNEAYQIVDRMGIRVLRDPYTTKGWVKFYSTKRVGGGVVNFEALKIGKVAA
jgi:HK97 family phage major capsid protein